MCVWAEECFWPSSPQVGWAVRLWRGRDASCPVMRRDNKQEKTTNNKEDFWAVVRFESDPGGMMFGAALLWKRGTLSSMQNKTGAPFGLSLLPDL